MSGKVGGISHHQLADWPNLVGSPTASAPNVSQATHFPWISANFFTRRLPSAGYAGGMGWVHGHIGPIFVGQAAIAALAMGAIAFVPPAQGRILVAPLNGQPVDQQLIRRANATPLVPGP